MASFCNIVFLSKILYRGVYMCNLNASAKNCIVRLFSSHSCALQRPVILSRIFLSHNCKKPLLRDRINHFSSSKHFCKNDTSNLDFTEEDMEEEVDEYKDLVKRVFHIKEMGHQVLVIQPYIKWGPSKKRITTPDLQLDEAVTLVGTLRNWKVVDKMKIALTSLEKKTLFGKGNLEMLREKVSKNKRITAVFVSVDILKGVQHRELEDVFNVPVFDRYMVVIQIFREHAVSREAKLQVAMAEIPYLRMRIKGLVEGAPDRQGAAVAAIGGAGETSIEIRRRVLNTREMKLKNMLQKLRNQRSLLRSKRQKVQHPVVAVVGYTNAGKTSLIKALTGEKAMEPKNHLFATLDVTAHAGFLRSELKVLFIDTVGFISDIPSNLIESFVATLEDAMLADVIIHVRDVSHPDATAQLETVNKTLESLNVNPKLLENIIVVGNKVDLISDPLSISDCHVLVSSVTRHGFVELLDKLEECVLKATGRRSVVIRVPSGGEEMQWLYKNTAVSEVLADPQSSEHLMMRVVISELELNKFKNIFIKR